ncbi:MAG TPA: phosphoribosylanthranilate isomerase [Pyrinomonadaceae bacterium]|jgi:phosphoribosylanthranilate isomerase
MVKVKICGITNLEDALSAVDAGADALGFNFYRPSPRFIKPAAARVIIDQLPSTVLAVGVFVNERDPETVARIADEAAVLAIQLHGDETPEYCRALDPRYVIKVLRVDESFRPPDATVYQTEAIMLDAFDREMRGGTGRVIDWSIAADTRQLVKKLFLSGGLSPENVANAIAAVRPYGVDACSRLESAPGRKDSKRVRAFIAAARSLESV